MKKIQQRLILIGILIVVSIMVLIPRNVSQRVFDPASGRMKDTTVRRVPINLGLDLQGGIHLALEVDESKGPVPDCADAIQRAQRIISTRINEFGTMEPVVQMNYLKKKVKMLKSMVVPVKLVMKWKQIINLLDAKDVVVPKMVVPSLM